MHAQLTRGRAVRNNFTEALGEVMSMAWSLTDQNAATSISSLARWGGRLTTRGIWTALEIPFQQAATEYEDREQIMAMFGHALPGALAAFLEKRAADFTD